MTGRCHGFNEQYAMQNYAFDFHMVFTKGDVSIHPTLITTELCSWYKIQRPIRARVRMLGDPKRALVGMASKKTSRRLD